jgi:hypothetical protein
MRQAASRPDAAVDPGQPDRRCRSRSAAIAGQKIAENMSERRAGRQQRRPTDGPPLSRALRPRDGSCCAKRCAGSPTACAAASPCARSAPRAASSTPKPPSAPTSSMRACPSRSSTATTASSPKLVVICDISTSMRYCSELMLSLVYALQDLVTKTHAFAFIDHLEFISPDFAARKPDAAIAAVLQRMPPATTAPTWAMRCSNSPARVPGHRRPAHDLHLGRRWPQQLQRPGARRSFGNWRVASRRMIWINPEPPMLWGSGDSDMLQYAPLCNNVVMAATLGELTDAVDELAFTAVTPTAPAIPLKCRSNTGTFRLSVNKIASRW